MALTNDADHMIEYLAVNYGRALANGGSCREMDRAVRIAKRISKLTGEAPESVCKAAADHR